MAGSRNLFVWASGSLAFMVVGAFGPWAKVLGIFSVSGTDGGDGWIVIALAAVAGLSVWRFNGHAAHTWPVLMLLAAAGGIATTGYDIDNLNGLASGNELFGAEIVSAGWGIYVALFASVSLAVVSVLMLRTVSAKATTEVPPAPDAGDTATS